MIASSRKEAGDKARAERKAKRKAEKAESERLADDRRKKQVKLNKLTSISGSGGREVTKSEAERLAEERRQQILKKNHDSPTAISGSGLANNPWRKYRNERAVCHNCGQKGHVGYECYMYNSGHQDDETK